MESIRIAVLVPPRVAMIEGKSKWGVVEFQPSDEQLAELSVSEREAIYRHRVKQDRTEQIPLRVGTTNVEWSNIVDGLRSEMRERETRRLELEREEARRREALPRVADCLRPSLECPQGLSDEQVVAEATRIWVDKLVKALPVHPSRVHRVRTATADWKRLKVIERKVFTPQAGDELRKLTKVAQEILPSCFTLESSVSRVVTRRIEGRPKVLPFTAIVLLVGTEAGQAVALLVRSDTADEKSDPEC